MKTTFLFITAFLALVSCSFAFDPSPLQDFCVAINDTKDGGNYAIFIYYYTTTFLALGNETIGNGC
jgi:hypothetical protein